MLGTIAGSPGIMFDAIRSGNIFDYAHVQRAQTLGLQCERGVTVLERYKRREAEIEQLRQMGMRMVGMMEMENYAHIEARVKDPGVPKKDWFLRIEADEEGMGISPYVDLTLGPYDHHIHDALLDATRYVPRFRALLFCPLPRVVYLHPSGCNVGR